jgi:hypothetical protein
MSLRGVTLFILAFGPLALGAQPVPSERGRVEGPVPDLPPLPGKGLAHHPFLYCGEWQRRSTSDQTKAGTSTIGRT